MRVLVVDDSRTMRVIIRKTLEGMNAPDTEIIEAADGAEALQLLRNERLEIDLVFLDWSMPRLDGIGFLKALKVLSPFRDVAVIMVTSQSQRGHVAEALRWGARDYIVKPFSEETLREKFLRMQTQVEARKCAETSLMLQTMAQSAEVDERASFLSQLPDELVVEMKLRGRRRACPAGVTIAYPHQILETLDIVLTGEVEVEGLDGRSEVAGEGRCYGEQSFVRGGPLGATVRARVPSEILQLSRLALGDLVKRFPKLNYALSSLVVRHTTTRRSKEVAAGFAGKLKAIPIADLLQVLQLCRKSGELRLDGGGLAASIFLEDGTILDACAGEVRGDEAVYEILGWTDAAFSFVSGARSDRKTVLQPTMMLLMEGARRLDERKKGKEAATP